MKQGALLVLILLALSACDKRYEDGPCISFVKAENRLCGRWSLTQVTSDGTDIHSTIQKDTLSAYSISIFRNLDNALFIAVIDTQERILAESLIRYNDRLTELTFGLGVIQGYEASYLPFIRQCPRWEAENTMRITRLKREELWMETVSGSPFVETRFELIYDYQNL